MDEEQIESKNDLTNNDRERDSRYLKTKVKFIG